MNTIKTPPNTQEIIQKGQAIYEHQKTKLEQYAGKYVAIEIESGEYFVGTTREDAVSQARVKYPSVVLFTRRIGTIEKITRFSPTYLTNSSYARIF